jgi:predicted ABC-type ATPase
MKDNPKMIILAGSNGAGKSTFYDYYLAPLGWPFVNADRIALEQFGTSDPRRSMEAARIADRVRVEHVSCRESFIYETVLSDPGGVKVASFGEIRKSGYWVELHFIGLASAQLSAARVSCRVEQGGHDVPEDKIRDRYERTLNNLSRCFDVVDRLTIYDNSEVDRPYRVVAVIESGQLLAVADPLPAWLVALSIATRRESYTQSL